jgi:uncharacterized tellurite resistance protein B-like protein
MTAREQAQQQAQDMWELIAGLTADQDERHELLRQLFEIVLLPEVKP